MPTGGGHTTVIQRILERRAERLPAGGTETTGTIAVMLRVMPPPKALLVCRDVKLCEQIERRITADMLDVRVAAQEHEALQLIEAEFCPVIVTDSIETVRRLRARPNERAPFIVYIAERDEAAEREAGLAAGADECVGRRVPERELEARLAVARRVAELENVVRITLAENRKLSATDDLTRVASRRFFGKHFPREVDRAARYGRPLSLILCDIDFFKHINDTVGHAGGDEILRQLGPRLQESLRRGIDWIARIGGEEFAVVLAETGYESALNIARKLRGCVAHEPFKLEAGKQSVAVTASFGLCGLDRVPAGERGLADRILKIADAALYRSKHSGRNRLTATMYGGASDPGSGGSAGAPRGGGGAGGGSAAPGDRGRSGGSGGGTRRGGGSNR
jgi:two-component system, cell cycle response regulator